MTNNITSTMLKNIIATHKKIKIIFFGDLKINEENTNKNQIKLY